jgi:hypothetical protein
MPLAVRWEGQVDPVAATCSGLGCARCGALRSLPPPRSDPAPDARAPALGMRAAWLARPSRRPPWRTGWVDRPLDKAKKKRRRREGDVAADMWALPGSERSKGEACGWSWWAGLVAGPAG